MQTHKTQKINQTQETVVKVICLECNIETSHNVKCSVKNNFCQEFDCGEAPFGYETHDWLEEYEIIECKGCETVSFRKFSAHDLSDPYNCAEYLYPLRIKGRKGLNEDTDYLPVDVKRIYLETLKALNSEMPILTGIGLRALVETVCKEKNATGDNLWAKIDDLIAQKVLTLTGAKILHEVRTLGNASAHEVKPHSKKSLGLAMDVVEHLLTAVYILPKKVEGGFD